MPKLAGTPAKPPVVVSRCGGAVLKSLTAVQAEQQGRPPPPAPPPPPPPPAAPKPPPPAPTYRAPRAKVALKPEAAQEPVPQVAGPEDAEEDAEEEEEDLDLQVNELVSSLLGMQGDNMKEEDAAAQHSDDEAAQHGDQHVKCEEDDEQEAGQHAEERAECGEGQAEDLEVVAGTDAEEEEQEGRMRQEYQIDIERHFSVYDGLPGPVQRLIAFSGTNCTLSGFNYLTTGVLRITLVNMLAPTHAMHNPLARPLRGFHGTWPQCIPGIVRSGVITEGKDWGLVFFHGRASIETPTDLSNYYTSVLAKKQVRRPLHIEIETRTPGDTITEGGHAVEEAIASARGHCVKKDASGRVVRMCAKSCALWVRAIWVPPGADLTFDPEEDFEFDP